MLGRKVELAPFLTAQLSAAPLGEAGLQGAVSARLTSCLLKRADITAGEIRYVAKERDRKWEEGDNISVLDFSATEYGRSTRVLAREETKSKILESA